MKQSTYKLLTATASGTFALLAAIGCLASIFDNSPSLAILAALLTILLSFICRVDLHDRKIALIKEDWRRGHTPADPASYCYLVPPSGKGRDQSGI